MLGEAEAVRGFEETLRPGGMWSWRLPRGATLRLCATAPRANVSTLLFNADDPLERYNMADTLKAQHVCRLTAGNVLFSDMGRVLASIIHDDCGWHDPLCGPTNAKMTTTKYGLSTYQESGNQFHRNGRDNFIVELGKHGLGKRDIVACVNLFSKVEVDEQGRLHHVACHAWQAQSVTLRMDMNVLVVLSNTPHPLDPLATYAPAPVTLGIRPGPAASADDQCRNGHPETARGFANNDRYFMRPAAAGLAQ